MRFVLALLVVGLGAGVLGAVRTEAQPAVATRTQVTSELASGFNLVGWLGADAEASAIVGSIAGAESVFTWDAESQSFASYSIDAPDFLNTAGTVSRGQGIWLGRGGGGSTEWAQTVRRVVTPIRLRPGFNLVAWLGAEGTSPADALRDLGDNLLSAFTFDASSGTFRSFSPSVPAILNTLTRLSSGDGLWLNVRDHAFWSQGNPRGGEQQTLTLRASDGVQSIGLHTVTAIDADGIPIDVIQVGTADAADAEGPGWGIVRSFPATGPLRFQSAAESSIRVPVPAETEGLLLRVRSAFEPGTMVARLEGEPEIRRPITTDWSDAYLPVGDAQPYPARGGDPVWMPERYFPTFNPAERLFVFPADTFLSQQELPTTGDFRVNDSPQTMHSLTLVGLQGIINRHDPSVFFDWEDPLSGADPFWSGLFAEYVPTVRHELDGVSAIVFLWRKYGHLFDGAVVYDPEMPDTINLATMIASLENRVILAPEQLTMAELPSFGDVTDLRDLAVANGWDNTPAGVTRQYEWVYETLWPQLDRRIVGLIGAGPPTAGFTPQDQYPVHLAPRDYLIALKLPAISLSVINPEQRTLLERFLADTDPLTPITGVFSNEEAAMIEFVSERGYWVSGQTWPGFTLASGGQTVFSAIRPPITDAAAPIGIDEILPALGDGPFVTLHATDGDNMSYQFTRGFYGGPEWVWPDVESLNVGWTVQPAMAEVAPVLWNYLAEERSAATLISGLSGVGYASPDSYSDEVLATYLDRTAEYLAETGIRTIQVNSIPGEGRWSVRLGREYHARLTEAGYLGSYFLSAQHHPGIHIEYVGTPAPGLHALGISLNNAESLVDEIPARDPTDFTVQTEDWPSPGWVRVDDAEAVGGEALLLAQRADSLGLSPTRSLDLFPGEYEVTVRLKVSAAASTEQFVRLRLSNQINNTNDEIAFLDVRASDFDAPDTYQAFTFTATVVEEMREMAVQLDVGGGIADLTVDEVRVRQASGPRLPQFTPLVIGLVGPIEPLPPVIGGFIENFEAAGGTVLTPDVFMAALNPEFMLELATSILGGDDEAVVQAGDELAVGLFFDSLVTVREALRTWAESR